jgi:hypothetical protein
VEVDGEAKLLAKDDERTSIDDERDIRKMKMARLLETVLTPLFFFFSDEKCFRMAVGVALNFVPIASGPKREIKGTEDATH